MLPVVQAFFPEEWHKPFMRWNMDSCRFRQKLVVLVTFLIFKWWSWTWKKTSCVLTQCHWHMVLMLSRLYTKLLALPLERLGILTLLPSYIFPFSSFYSKKTQTQKTNTQTQLTIISIKKSSSRYQFLKSLSKLWELGWMLHYRSVAFNSGVFRFQASSSYLQKGAHV